MPTRLTDRGIAGLKHSGRQSSDHHFDSEVSGLAVRVYRSGRKAFVFEWREPGRGARRKTLGRPPVWTIGKARVHASRLRLKANVGETVAARRGAQLKDLAEQWLATVKLTRRPSTAKGYLHLLDRHVLPRFGKSDPRTVTRNALETWHGEIARRTPIAANRALAVFSAFLSWLAHDRVIDRNPALGIKRRPENARHVFLGDGEIAATHAALDADADRRAALALKLELLTGCRIGEAINPALGEQIDAKHALWVKPASSTKQRKQHITPLSTTALAVARELVALGPPNYGDCCRVWDRVKAAIGRPDVRIHDLRHTHASALARNGASLPQIGRLLGHTAPATTQRYLHLVNRDLVDLVERTS